MTNGDRIRQMSNEELVKIILCSGCSMCHYLPQDDCRMLRCEEGIKAYLESEVE